VDVEVACVVAEEEAVAMGVDHERRSVGRRGGYCGFRRAALDAGVGNERHVWRAPLGAARAGGGCESLGEGIDELDVDAVERDHDVVHGSPDRDSDDVRSGLRRW
jgi:hypothetical protein